MNAETRKRIRTHDPMPELSPEEVMCLIWLDRVEQDAADNAGRREARWLLRLVLARRQLAASAEQGGAIDACTDIETLRRWLDQAVTARSTEESLA